MVTNETSYDSIVLTKNTRVKGGLPVYGHRWNLVLLCSPDEEYWNHTRFD